ncbi:MAG: GFA family protein [Kofleriaceae bacterium]
MASYTGSCHCGEVKYKVELELGEVISCNCSMCGKSGTLLTFAPVDKFELISGEDSLTPYQFNKHIIMHNFCKTCGIKSFARGKKPDGTPMVAINARCLDGVDVFDLKVKQFNGRAL